MAGLRSWPQRSKSGKHTPATCKKKSGRRCPTYFAFAAFFVTSFLVLVVVFTFVNRSAEEPSARQTPITQISALELSRDLAHDHSVGDFLAENTYGYRAVAFLSRVVLEVRGGVNQTIFQQNQQKKKQKRIEDSSVVETAVVQSAVDEFAVQLQQVVRACYKRPDHPFPLRPPLTPAISLPTTSDYLYVQNTKNSSFRPWEILNRDLSQSCFTDFFYQLNGDPEARNRGMVRDHQLDPAKYTSEQLINRKVTDALITEKMLEGFFTLPEDDSKRLPASQQDHLESSFGVSFAETKEVSGDDFRKKKSQSTDLLTTAQQCIRNAHTVSVLNMDVDALRGASWSAPHLVRSGSKIDFNPQWNPMSPPTILRDEGISQLLEKEFRFSNKKLFTEDSVAPTHAEGANEQEERELLEANMYNWSHATFYHGPPRDSEDFLTDPVKFAKTKVPWVNGNGRQSHLLADLFGNSFERSGAIDVVGDKAAEPPHYNYWGDYDDELHDGNLPCTQYMQHRLHALMNPKDCGDEGEDNDRGFVDLEKFKFAADGAEEPFVFDPFDTIEFHRRRTPTGERRYHTIKVFGPPRSGAGSAIQKNAVNFLTAITLGRIALSRADDNLQFANPSCRAAGRHGMECYWQPWSRCQYKERGAKDEMCMGPCTLEKLKTTLKNVTYTSSHAWWTPGNRDAMPPEAFFGESFVRGTRRLGPEHRDHSNAVDAAMNSSSTSSSVPKCYLRYKRWLKDPRNNAFNYMQAQVLRYIMRYQQPWFHNMLAQGMRSIGVSPLARETTLGTRTRKRRERLRIFNSKVARKGETMIVGTHTSDPIIFLHERGEPAKFRENHCYFGCHKIDSHMLVNLTQAYCENLLRSSSAQTSVGVHRKDDVSSVSARSLPKCQVYLSGNIPPTSYEALKRWLEPGLANRVISDAATRDAISEEAVPSYRQPIYRSLKSTWELGSSDTKSLQKGDNTPKAVVGNARAVSVRYGASSPAASWVDLYAGAASSHWACVMSSNWCGLLTKMRSTSGKGVCTGVADFDSLMHMSNTLRERYCVIDHRYSGC